MNVIAEPMRGVRHLALPASRDGRGEFVKTFHASSLAEHGMAMELREAFFSISREHVLRGMHFQTPPADSTKLVMCVTGQLLDVIVDLRKNEPTYGTTWSVTLSADTRQAIWIPSGIAHGFLSLADDTCMAYLTEHEHSPEHDAGIRWDSFEFDWPCDPGALIISDRDRDHPTLDQFESPFME